MRKYQIPKADRKAWLEALESGKYKQGKRLLKSTNGTYCCLGVYGVIKGIDEFRYNFINVGMPCQLNPIAQELYPKCLRGSFGEKSFANGLALMNDKGKSFKEIAKYIRKHTIGI